MSGDLDYFGADDPSPTADDVRAGRAVLTSGDKGDGVVYVQALVGAVADGDFGPNTVAAVKAFQSAHGLKADGVVGTQTMAALDQLAGRAPTTPSVHGIVRETNGKSSPENAAAALAALNESKPKKKKTGPLVYGGIAAGAVAVVAGIWAFVRG